MLILSGDFFKFLLCRWYPINNIEWSKLGKCNIVFQRHRQSLIKKSDKKSFMKSDGDPYYSWCFCINYPIVTSRNSFVHVQKEKKETGCKVMLNMFKLEQCQLVPVFFFFLFFFFLLIWINSYNMQHIKLMLFRLTKHYFYQLDKKISGVIFISTFMI